MRETRELNLTLILPCKVRQGWGKGSTIRVEMFALCFVELPLLKTRYQPLRKTLGSIKVYLWWYHPSTSFVKRALKFYQLSVLRGFLRSLLLSLGGVAAIKHSHARKANFSQNPSVSRQSRLSVPHDQHYSRHNAGLSYQGDGWWAGEWAGDRQYRGSNS